MRISETLRVEEPGAPDIVGEMRKGQVDHLHEVAIAQRRLGPRDALRALELAFKSPDDVGAWIEHARLAALLGGCRLSINSLRSGIRCYITFVSKHCTCFRAS